MDLIDIISRAFDTPARRWINSPEVTAFCNQARKEREMLEALKDAHQKLRAAQLALPTTEAGKMYYSRIDDLMHDLQAEMEAANG